jgi:hypothetical protein
MPPACLGQLDVRLLVHLTRSPGNSRSRMSSDHGPTPSSILSCIDHFAMSMICLPKHKDPGISSFTSPAFLVPLCSLVRLFRFYPGIDVDARLRLKRLPRIHSARAQDQRDLEVLSAHGR